MNDQNLIPANRRSKTEARENGRKGGKASGEARKQRKAIKTAILDAIYAETPAGTTVLEEMVAGVISRVIKTGDPQALEKLMEYADKSPKRNREEAELKLKQAQAEQAEQTSTGTAAEAWADVLGQIREVMENDEADGSS